jgi:UDP-N-acetylmuramyl pentapeptide phosphotransferase/UDP-N-acetylglucosamine-1-phosphate transferase
MGGVVPFLIAALAALLLTPLMIAAAPRLGLVDRPGALKVHASPIPLAGAAVAIAAPGLVAIAGVGLALLVGGTGAAPLAATGAACGFLLWNRPPARAFLGDGGAYALGVLLVAGAADASASGWPGLLAAGACLGVFAYELLSTVVRAWLTTPPRSPETVTTRTTDWPRV